MYTKFISLFIINFSTLYYICLMSLITKATSNYRGTQPLLGKVLIGFSGVSVLLAAYNYLQAKSAQAEVKYRKAQLQKPIYKLSGEEMVNPPWNKGNLRQWLYRRVEVTGRPIHRLQMMIPRSVSGKPGYQCVVPLVARETKDRSEREGILFSRGYIPYAFKTIGNRYKIEDVERQTFVGFISTLPELASHGWTEGNAYQEGRLKYNYSNVEDMARSAGFKNKKQASVALVERLFEVGDLNERRGKRYSHDADGALDYPYYKTEAGALQLPSMPWDFKNRAKGWFVAGIASFVVGASVF